MDIVITDLGRAPVRQIGMYYADFAYGDDENDFELTCDADLAPRNGCMVYADGSEWGGFVDEVSYDTATGAATCRGRTIHGALADKRIVPDAGKSHYKVSGPVEAALSAVVSRIGLSGVYEVEKGASAAISYTFDRFTDAYSGIRKMLKAHSLRLAMRCVEGRVLLSAQQVRTIGGKADSDLVDFVLTDVGRCYNHLVCAGEGEGDKRVVIHLYADAAGKVSKKQTLFGLDERTAFYDYNAADAEKLEAEGVEKLREMQTKGGVEVTVPESLDAEVGDVLVGRDNATGVEVAAEVAKKILRVKYGDATVGYEVGNTSATSSTIVGTGESSGGGHAYYAGEGLTLSGYTFAADVTQAELDAVGATAESARKTASDAQAAAGRAQQTADGKADAGHGHVKADISDFPASMPASDVSAWAKAATKPTYTPAEVGAAPKSHAHPWGEIAGRPTAYPPEAHTHPYAGAQSAGGTANSAAKLATARKITLDGAVSGSATFDGSADVTITVEGDSAAAGFLAAHPVGFYVECKSGVDPNAIGGTWAKAPSMGPCVWLRTK